MRIRSWKLAVPLLIVLATACTDPGSNPVEVKTTGTVVGLVYVDRDGDQDLSTGDAPLEGVEVSFSLPNRSTPTATATSNAQGVFFIRNVPVGRYTATVTQSTVPDSLRIERVDSGTVLVAADDTTRAYFRAEYPTLSIREARTEDLGTRVFIIGKMLNSWTTFGDSTIHFADTSAAIRGTRVAPTNVQGGDSVRVLGRLATREGQPVLFDSKVFFLGPSQAPPPTPVTTAKAASADGGSLDAALVSIANAVVKDTATLRSGDHQFTVNDGSGPVDMVLDRHITFSLQFQDSILGSKLNAAGLLVPREGGAWTLKPRTNLDVEVIGAFADLTPAGRR